MAQLPAMPLFTDAYLADCDHLTDAEHGRYLLMLIHMWRAPNQRFPNDDAWLARKFRRSVDEVRAELRPLIEEFFRCDGNWISQKRLVKEFAVVSARVAQRSAASKSRWNKENGTSVRNADAQPPRNAPTPKDSESVSSVESNLQETESFEAPRPGYRWSGRVIRLKAGHYESWRKSYHGLADLDAELQSLDDYLASDRSNDAERKNWFPFVSGALRKRHLAALAAAKTKPRVNGSDPFAGLSKWEQTQLRTRAEEQVRSEGLNPHTTEGMARVGRIMREGADAQRRTA